MGELTPAADVPEAMLGLLALAVRSAPRGGRVHLTVQDGDRLGRIAVDAEEARYHLGLDSHYRPPAGELEP